eukprot:CAMPEP_0175049826 /NCGR_PEP_ID=MMETSP0052_2-20121109/6935_1 /TAXON_ID=51329 ORGANISM="Polytomella parva, Strain SAG 63-3" /NCGR_SAMPLE_ID=MMETSP0052_2 /ASSEMBLY_ACC=CAM_ASM_000194 /LENGTH=131 /DNA_ID=CAMNT_0016313993 /DNA_START=27 /DNA_END=419 /DNA_ORIENTATION=+
MRKSYHRASAGYRSRRFHGATSSPAAFAEAVTQLKSWFASWVGIPVERSEGWLHWSSTNPNSNGQNGAPVRHDITMEEVKKHNTAEDAWTTLNNKVYNLTPYLKFHPGGSSILLKVAGKDCYSLFMKYHAW